MLACGDRPLKFDSMQLHSLGMLDDEPPGRSELNAVRATNETNRRGRALQLRKPSGAGGDVHSKLGSRSIEGAAASDAQNQP
jgi:hypothetical protein